MHYAPTYQSRTTTDVGGNAIGPKLIGLRTVAAASVLGGAPSTLAYSATDFPRVYAAQVKKIKLPIIGNNSEQIAFPRPAGGMVIGPSGTFGFPDFPLQYVVSRFKLRGPLRWQIGGVTKDSTGTPLGSCVVKLYLTATDQELAQTTSDGSGNYAFSVTDNATSYYAVAYKAGSPDVAGTTLNTLKGA